MRDRSHGEFIHRNGFVRHQCPRKPQRWHDVLMRPFRPGPRYEITMDAEKPLTFVWPSGVRWRTNKHYYSDSGSIPMIAQAVVGAGDLYLLPYMFHDDIYRAHGIWISNHPDDPFRFCPLTRAEADRSCLHEMILADGGTVFDADLIRGTVRLCGWAPWRSKPKRNRTKGRV